MSVVSRSAHKHSYLVTADIMCLPSNFLAVLIKSERVFLGH